ncbi:MAG: Transcriptional repressor NrdR [Candidatus Gottesmanbacteria bacterium GW2011_GWA1_43_11]|uniref:Transcriptional repressor NrdR n=1 Tax=Candidatus Gottesmanbacteria bacterium GW2011_GWA1_43_11 TaxID=1618436 RepID=A0A0G1CEW2_9BACT|nr:MAG: Transcriptional repressor NrdR [Candidatus Gottesmanbacteria bacterium GW2011_GWA1_43_11]
MKCPFCLHETSEVVETRDSDDLSLTRRRRECIKCGKRFTTYERIEMVPLTVLKKNGSREAFDREKLLRGIFKSVEKTTVGHEQVTMIVDEIERELRSANSVEIESRKIGDLVARKLKQLDKVAYIRFASVFKRFVDVEEFEKELHKLL